ncbi:hypothetical protein FOA52_008605 [Chlamydomonas sp. UWO 241]|nr:hypothetical protein FOA52_008605 [Chlamydomonas sp. UWO 241]
MVGELLARVVSRGPEMGLAAGGGADESAHARWSAALARVAAAMTAHLDSLSVVRAAAAAAGSSEALAMVAALTGGAAARAIAGALAACGEEGAGAKLRESAAALEA